MGDTSTTPLPGAGEGTAPNTSAPAGPKQPQGGVQQPGEGAQVVTRDDVLAIFHDLFGREKQSIVDATTAKVQRIVKTLQAEGVQATPQQVQALLSEAGAKESAPAASPIAPAQGAAGGEGEPLHPLLATAQGMMEKAGVYIEDGDPELSVVDMQTDDEVVFLSSVREAISQKRARVAQAGSPARMPSLTKGGPSGGKAVLTEELDRLLSGGNVVANMPRIRELKEQIKNLK